MRQWRICEKRLRIGTFCVSYVSILPGKPRKPQLLFKETPSQRCVAHMQRHVAEIDVSNWWCATAGAQIVDAAGQPESVRAGRSGSDADVPLSWFHGYQGGICHGRHHG